MKTFVSLSFVLVPLVSSMLAGEIPSGDIRGRHASPFDNQVTEQIWKLNAQSEKVRAVNLMGAILKLDACPLHR